MSEVVLEMKNVTKRFPGVIALKEVSIAVEKGEVMAICGENGAGKSTLMKVLSGSYSHKEYEGEIWINGKREEFSCISDAERCGIEMVYQELNMILVASVAENLYVGNLPGNGAFVDWKKLYADTRKILESVDMGHIDHAQQRSTPDAGHHARRDQKAENHCAGRADVLPDGQ